MNLKVNYIPPGWQPGNPKAIAKWMEKLPPNKEIETLIKRDNYYDKSRTVLPI